MRPCFVTNKGCAATAGVQDPLADGGVSDGQGLCPALRSLPLRVHQGPRPCLPYPRGRAGLIHALSLVHAGLILTAGLRGAADGERVRVVDDLLRADVHQGLDAVQHNPPHRDGL
eukprot:2507160-Rhodomonas_salina.1